EKFVWETKTISRVGYGELGVAAINRVTGEFCAIAKIFAVRPAISALTIGPAKPWNADAIANRKSIHALIDLFEPADNLMTENQWKFWIGQFAIDNVKIGPANRAGINANE